MFIVEKDQKGYLVKVDDKIFRADPVGTYFIEGDRINVKPGDNGIANVVGAGDLGTPAYEEIWYAE